MRSTISWGAVRGWAQGIEVPCHGGDPAGWLPGRGFLEGDRPGAARSPESRFKRSDVPPEPAFLRVGSEAVLFVLPPASFWLYKSRGTGVLGMERECRIGAKAYTSRMRRRFCSTAGRWG